TAALPSRKSPADQCHCPAPNHPPPNHFTLKPRMKTSSTDPHTRTNPVIHARQRRTPPSAPNTFYFEITHHHNLSVETDRPSPRPERNSLSIPCALTRPLGSRAFSVDIVWGYFSFN